MIRKSTAHDMDIMLDIWLNASIQAHDFVEASYWQSQRDNMRNVYLPASENYVYEQDSNVVGFYALYDDCLAALFVAPEHQGCGIGSQLIEHAKRQRELLTLSVYTKNNDSVAFYLKHGFEITIEQTDPNTGQSEYSMKLLQG